MFCNCTILSSSSLLMPFWWEKHGGRRTRRSGSPGFAAFEEQEHFQKIGRQHGVVVASATVQRWMPKSHGIFWTQRVIHVYCIDLYNLNWYNCYIYTLYLYLSYTDIWYMYIWNMCKYNDGPWWYVFGGFWDCRFFGSYWKNSHWIIPSYYSYPPLPP